MGRRLVPPTQAVVFDPEFEEDKICPWTDKELIDNLFVFTERITGGMRIENMGLYNYQRVFVRRIIESIVLRDVATITAIFSRQSGKTESVATAAAGCALLLPIISRQWPKDPRLQNFVTGFRCGIFAPKEDQALLSYHRIRKLIESPQGQAVLNDPDFSLVLVSSTKNAMTFSHGSEIQARTASDTSHSQGYTFHLVILDEAHLISRAKVEQDIRPSLAATAGSMAMIGTAWLQKGGFHTAIQHNEQHFKRTNDRRHFSYDYKLVLRERQIAYDKDRNPFHLNYALYIKEQKHRLGGIDTEDFKMNFELKWGESGALAFSQAVINNARRADLDLNVPSREQTQVAALDVAKRSDSSILTVLHVDMNKPIVDVPSMYTGPRLQSVVEEDDRNMYYQKTVIGLLEMQGNFEGDAGQYQKALAFLSMFNVSVLLVDATGMGDPVYERFQVLLPDIRVEAFKYSTPSKSDLYKYALQEWNAGRVHFPGSPSALQEVAIQRFERQHLDLDKSQEGAYIRCEAPEGEHDDYPDSCALAIYAERLIKDTLMPYVHVTNVGVPSVVRRRLSNPVDGPSDNPFAGLDEQEAVRRAKQMYGREYRYISGRGGKPR